MLTVRDDLLSDLPVPSRVLESLSHRAQVTTIPVAPLSASEGMKLVRGLLGLEPTLAARVEEKAGGNPMFAVRLVGEQITSGLLVPGPRGFELAPGATLELPDDVSEMFHTQIERLVQLRPPADAIAMELAAALGHRVDPTEWRRLCSRAGQRPGPGLVELLVARNLARHDEGTDSWEFAHGMLREALVTRAREAGRWEQHNRRCVRLLEGVRAPGIAERRGRHLLEAGDAEEALPELRAACEERDASGDARGAMALARDYGQVLQRLEVGPTDPRRWPRIWETSDGWRTAPPRWARRCGSRGSW